MNLTAATVDLGKLGADVTAVTIFEGKKLSSGAVAVDAATSGLIKRVLRSGDMTGKAGETLLIHVPDQTNTRVLLVGVGKRNAIKTGDYARIARALAAAVNKLAARSAIIDVNEVSVAGQDETWAVRCAASALLGGRYSFTEMKSSPTPKASPLKKITFVAQDRKQVKALGALLDRVAATDKGMALARDLGNLPGNVCTPSYLASAARKMAAGNAKLKAQVLTEKELEKLGMGSFLAVAAGSDEPPRLIVLQYQGGANDRRPVVLVGKGVTFDSGGISLKPGAAMDEMKFDMCGAASVLGTIRALVELDAPVNVVGVIAATENLPSGSAVKPGDIVTTMAGKTVEILNTDAEGRLILCDALTYAERFQPDVVVDIATLTGACMVALGQVATGLFSNDDGLANELTTAGEATGDRAWRMPVWDDYQEQLSSNFADFANIGGRFAGAVTAACFLARFATEQRWAHLDIAGTAWHSGGAKGATGRPVPMLTEFVLNHGQGRKRSSRRSTK